MTSKEKFMKYSLGAEEVALALGMINTPILARNVLTSIYPNDSEVQLDARLASASHSMLARGLTFIKPEGTAVLDHSLEKVVFPFAKFDYILDFSLFRDNKQVHTLIRVQNRGLFTSQIVKDGVVYVLESGKTEDLNEFILDAIQGFAPKKSQLLLEAPELKLKLLGQAINLGNKEDELIKHFSKAGWKDSDAKMVAEDLSNQIIRGAMLRINGDSQVKPEDAENISRLSLLLLKGRIRSWVFIFNSADDESNGKAFVVDQTSFKQILHKFLS